jgi:hypothetical protein
MAEAKQKGSKIFPDTVPFKYKHRDELKEKVDRYLGEIGLVSVLVGSGSDPDVDPEASTADLDLMVDLQSIMDYFKTDDKSMARKQLSNYLQDRGFQTVQKGVNVFLRMPYGKYAHQVDLECIHKVAKVSRYHQHRIPKGSPYKGVNKQLLLAILAKSKGYVYSAWEGLYIRTPENKKGDLVTDDWDEIAEKLVGVRDGNRLDSVEAILQTLPKDQAQALLAHAKTDKNWAEKPATTVAEHSSIGWFKDIYQKIGL